MRRFLLLSPSSSSWPSRLQPGDVDSSSGLWLTSWPCVAGGVGILYVFSSVVICPGGFDGRTTASGKTISHHISVCLCLPPAPPRNDLVLTLDRFEPSLYTSCGAKTSHMSCASLHLEIATEAHSKMAAHMTQRPMLHLFQALLSRPGLLQHSAILTP